MTNKQTNCANKISTLATAKSSKYNRDYGLNKSSPLAFFDDFTNKILSSNLWNVGDFKWGPDFNHGVRPENVLWNKDGIVTIKSYGKYFSDPQKNYQGGTLISKLAYGPGRFETKMKMVPRFGTSTAFWTFMYGDSLDLMGNLKSELNQEIDIELNVNQDFKSVWFTNWHTEKDSTHVSKLTKINNADGDWHIYAFEWHTSPNRIDYYIDNELIYTSYTHVPYVAGNIFIGNWFPRNWAGNADFEEDYMQIDYISYTPYENKPYVNYNKANFKSSTFPTKSLPLPPVANMIADASFTNSPLYEKYSIDKVWELSKNIAINKTAGKNKSGLLLTTDSFAKQIVTDIISGYEYYVKASVKLLDINSHAKLYIKQLDKDKTQIGKTQVLDISDKTINFIQGEFFNLSLNFKASTKTKFIELGFTCIDGSLALTNVFMNTTYRLKNCD